MSLCVLYREYRLKIFISALEDSVVRTDTLSASRKLRLVSTLVAVDVDGLSLGRRDMQD